MKAKTDCYECKHVSLCKLDLGFCYGDLRSRPDGDYSGEAKTRARMQHMFEWLAIHWSRAYRDGHLGAADVFLQLAERSANAACISGHLYNFTLSLALRFPDCEV